MVRMQVQLTEQQMEALKQISARTGISLAGLIRQGVDQYLAAGRQISDQEKRDRARAVAGRFASGMKDVSAEHDRHLREAFSK